MTAASPREVRSGGAVVVAMGARGPLGFDAITMIMGARAALLDVDATPFVDRRGEAIGMSRSPSLPDDLQGGARFIALGAPALREAAAGLVAATPLFLALPEAGRADDDPAFSSILADLAAKSGVAIDLAGSEVIRAGHAAGAVALARAVEHVERSGSDALVGGIDSYFHEGLLHALDADARLQHIEGDDCFIPGEAAAFVRLGRRAPDGSPAKASIIAVEHGVERTVRDGQPNVGAETTRIARRVLAAHGGEVGWVLVDDNGELVRSEEWVWTVIREPALKRAAHVALPRLFADVGAATGPLALVLASVFWEVGCAPARDALVVLRSDAGERGAFVVEAGR